MKRTTEKIISAVLTLIIVFTQFSVLGLNGITYALQDGGVNTNVPNVEFDVYFNNGLDEISSDIKAEELKMYLNIKVKQGGYLKNGIVSFGNENFSINQNIKIDKIEEIQDIKDNKIYLKQVDAGDNIIIELPIIFKTDDKVSQDYLSKEGNIYFEGKYIDANGREKNVEATKKAKIIWKSQIEVEAKAELNKYIPYHLNEQYGVILQYKINSNLKDNILPIKATNIVTNIPNINEQNPTNIKVYVNNTKATNGKADGLEFNNSNWNINEEENNLTINVQNLPDSYGNISWTKKATDEYFITYVFEGQEAYNYVQNNFVEILTNVNVKITAYGDEELEAEKILNTNNRLNQEKGTITEYRIKSENESISKGYLYSNNVAKEKKETELSMEYEIDISFADILEYIEVDQEVEDFLNEGNDKITSSLNNQHSIYTKTISVDEKIFNKILGEDGFIEILVNGTKVGKLDKENYEFDCSNLNINKLTLKTSAPINEGTLIIKINKAIKGESGFNKEQVKALDTLNSKITGKTEFGEEEKETSIKFKEPVSKAEITINKKQLSTAVGNENVEIRAILDTSSIDNSLYKNPTIKIIFPEYFEKIKINEAKLLFEEELTVKNMKWENTEKNKVLFITLDGEQTIYNEDSALKGATISLLADITLNTLTPTGSQDIIMQYTNVNDDLDPNSETPTRNTSTKIEYATPTGVVAATGISNYADGQEEILSVSAERQEATVNIASAARTVKTRGIIINNNKNSLTNVSILGRLPFKDNKQIDTNEDLGSTFSVSLKNNITVTGVQNAKIYYSTKENATKDLANAQNGWTQTVTNLEKVKSYLIVLENTEVKSGDTIEFSYNAEIPANLSHNNSSCGAYKVYYTNNEVEGVHEETKLSSLVGLSTGDGPKLNVTLSSNIPEGSDVREGQIVKFFVTIENRGQKTAEDVKLKIEAPEQAENVELIPTTRIFETLEETTNIELENIKPGESIVKPYEIRIKNGMEIPTQIINKVKVSAKDLGETISNAYNLNILEGSLAIEMDCNRNGLTILKEGEVLDILIRVANISDKELENVVYTFDVPKSLDITDAKITSSLLYAGDSDNITINNNKITANLGKLNPGASTLVKIKLVAKEIDNTIRLVSYVKAKNVPEHYSNEISFTENKIKAKIEQIALTEDTLKPNDQIKYKVNISVDRPARNVKIKNIIPEEFDFVKATFKNGKETYEVEKIDKNTFVLDLEELSQEISIEMLLKAKTIKTEKPKEIAVTTVSTVSINNNKEIQSNVLKYYLQTVEQGTGSISQKRFKIGGTTWTDENKNGKRDEQENLMANIEVLLLNKNSGHIVQDIDTKTEKRVTTDENGRYQFLNLEKGEYYVVFLYDNANYAVTEYNKTGVDIGTNSDVVEMEMLINGQKRKVAISDIIKITDKDVRNIDAGFCLAQKFDLKLDKTISKITLTTPTNGTEVYNYNNTNLAKIDIRSGNIGKSNIVIEYKISVTNEGDVAGFAKKIVDYIPKGTKFNSELNPDWYMSGDGNVYCHTLADTKINPGETKEVTLILSCTITENLIGEILNNNAEIYEAYNEYGLKDIDSIDTNEKDDLSNADIVISVATGKIITYILFALSIILLITISTIIIKKRVLDKKV